MNQPRLGRSVPAGFITSDGRRLVLDEEPFRFTGINAYELATTWGVNAGCGPMPSAADIDALFAGLRPRSMVRVWAWQGSMATNVNTKQRDWSAIDRVVAAAAKHGHKLIVSLTGQGGGCDDGRWKDALWYAGGYRLVANNDPRTHVTTSYWDYLHEIVPRYRSSPAIGMWELVGEPEVSASDGAGCTDHEAAARLLRHFFDTVGGEVKRIDPAHLIHSGVIGTGQCGTAGDHYTYLHESPAIDVASYHDYGADTSPMPGDQWNGLKVRLDAMRAIGKPLVVSEVGIAAQRKAPGCKSLETRASQMRKKMDAMYAAGASGFMPWNWMPRNDGSCAYETIAQGDPLMGLLRNYRL